MRAAAIVPAFRPSVGCEMLDGRDDWIFFVVLHSFDYGFPQFASQVRILTEVFFHARPARVAGEVDHRSVADMPALLADFHRLSLAQLT